jgi:hypothetical protein
MNGARAPARLLRSSELTRCAMCGHPRDLDQVTAFDPGCVKTLERLGCPQERINLALERSRQSFSHNQDPKRNFALATLCHSRLMIQFRRSEQPPITLGYGTP